MAALPWDNKLHYPSATLSAVKGIGAVVFLAYLIKVTRHRHERINLPPQLGVVVVLFLWIGLSMMVSVDPTYSVSKMLRYTLFFSFFFLVLMGSDTGAYYTGRLLGKHKLAPSISPGKTWEGAVGGMAATLLLAALAHFWFFRELSLVAALALAAVMNVLGVVGDLTESALKRGAKAKDAAQILPGHGGFLDRLDSLLFNAPLIYYFALYYWR